MIDQQLLNEVIVQRVQLFIDNLKDESIEDAVVAQLHIPSLKKVEELKEVISLVYTGNLLLYFEDEGLLFSSNIAKKPNRNPEETNIESHHKRAEG